MPEGVPTIQPAKSVEYETPHALFDELWEEHGGFDLDPCCRPEHYTAQRVLKNGGEIMIPPPPNRDPNLPTISGWAGAERTYYDGLKMYWKGKAFVNPPYGNALKLWVPKAVHEVECGNAELVVALLPSKTDVVWWHEYVCSGIGWCGDRRPYVLEVRFIKGRLKFAGEEGPARHGSVIVVWRK